jgi:hypothetical protein
MVAEYPVSGHKLYMAEWRNGSRGWRLNDPWAYKYLTLAQECMIRRRAKAAGIAAEIGCHTFRATGITAYLANGRALERVKSGRCWINGLRLR